MDYLSMPNKIICPYDNLLQIYFVAKEKGFCKLGLSFRKELTNPHGNFHGGVIASLIDATVVQGLRTLFLTGPYLTVNLAIRYKNPSSASEIFAEARPGHWKGKFFKSIVKVKDREDKIIAEAEVKSFLPNWKEKKVKVTS